MLHSQPYTTFPGFVGTSPSENQPIKSQPIKRRMLVLWRPGSKLAKKEMPSKLSLMNQPLAVSTRPRRRSYERPKPLEPSATIFLLSYGHTAEARRKFKLIHYLLNRWAGEQIGNSNASRCRRRTLHAQTGSREELCSACVRNEREVCASRKPRRSLTWFRRGLSAFFVVCQQKSEGSRPYIARACDIHYNSCIRPCELAHQHH